MNRETNEWDSDFIEKEFRKMITAKLDNEHMCVCLEYDPPSGEVAVSASAVSGQGTEGRVTIAALDEHTTAGDILRDHFEFDRERAEFGEHGGSFADFCENGADDPAVIRKIMDERSLAGFVCWEDAMSVALSMIAEAAVGIETGLSGFRPGDGRGSAARIPSAVELYRQIRNASKANAHTVLERWANHDLTYDPEDGSLHCFPCGDVPSHIEARGILAGILVPMSEAATACRYVSLYSGDPEKGSFGREALSDAVRYVLRELREKDYEGKADGAGRPVTVRPIIPYAWACPTDGAGRLTSDMVAHLLVCQKQLNDVIKSERSLDKLPCIVSALKSLNEALVLMEESADEAACKQGTAG